MGIHVLFLLQYMIFSHRSSAYKLHGLLPVCKATTDSYILHHHRTAIIWRVASCVSGLWLYVYIYPRKLRCRWLRDRRSQSKQIVP